MFTKNKSPETFFSPTLKHLENLIQIILQEQRHQRADLATIKRQLHTIINSSELQKQVDEYFEDEADKYHPVKEETSPQTESVEQ